MDGLDLWKNLNVTMIFGIAIFIVVAGGVVDSILGLLIFERANRCLPEAQRMNPFSIATPGRVAEVKRRYRQADPSGRLLFIRRIVRLLFLIAAATVLFLFIRVARKGGNLLEV